MKPLPHALACLALLAPLAGAQSTSLVSVATNGTQGDDESFRSSISADGRYVAFDSWATTLVPGDTNGFIDVFWRDRQSGQTVLVSVGALGEPGDSISQSPSISADGRYVAFSSIASNLVAGDTNGVEDVFVRDIVTGTTVRASVDSSGAQGGHFSNEPTISADGNRVAFSSFAPNLVPGDTNMWIDVFVHDFSTGLTVRVNVSSAGAQANSQARFPMISADGTRVAFTSEATNLVVPDSNLVRDAFVHDLGSGQTVLASLATSGAQANQATDHYVSVSADARFVAFTSAASNLAPGDVQFTNDVFVRDMLVGQTTCISVNSAGIPVGLSVGPAISGDGRFVSFTSGISTLVPSDTNGATDVFLRDRLLGTTRLLSLDSAGNQGNGHSGGPLVLSADGRYAIFTSAATNLVAGDTNVMTDIFLRDRGTLAATPFCFGDGTQATPCPCANSGAAGRGCENSAGTGGARLSVEGFADPDSAVFSARSMLPTSLAIFLQGNASVAAASFGDGLLCTGGLLLRLYSKTAAGGSAGAPELWDQPLGVQSALLGDPLAPGASRYYQTYYRDLDALFCPAPSGDLWNISNGVRVDW